MLKRSITAVFIVIGLVTIGIFSRTPVLPIAMSSLATMGVWEMFKCSGIRKYNWVYIPSLVIAAAMPICVRFFTTLNVCIISYLAIFYVMLVFFMTCAVFTKKGLDFSDALVAFGTTFYIVFGFTAVVMLRDIKFGGYICLLAVGAPWISDAFAYITGRLFGKHKLIPQVSPKKTVEGSIGGIVFCAAVCVLLGYIAELIDKDINKANLVYFAVAGVIISVVSQLGDLIASMIKRKYGIKDYSNIFPGHGGVLDRFDSVLTTAPFLLLLVILPLGFEMFT